MLPHAGDPADAIIVLGGGIHRDGTLTNVSQARVQRALELYCQGVAPRLIMTGRCGAFFRKPVGEAVAMAALARANELPAQTVLVEEAARDTLGNALFTRDRHLAPNGWSRVHVVTSDFHYRRAATLFRDVLGAGYQYSFSLVASGNSRSEIALRLLEPIKIALLPAARFRYLRTHPGPAPVAGTL